MKRVRLAVGAALSALGLLGCTALLGTFEISDSNPDAPEGGDAPVATESGADGAADAPVDAAAALLKCAVGNEVRMVDTARPPMGGGSFLGFDEPYVFHLTDTQVRIVTRPSHSVGFSIYEFNPRNGSGGGPPKILDVPVSSGILAVHRTINAILVLGIGVGPNQGRLELHRIADDAFVDTIIPLTPPNTFDGMGIPGVDGPNADFVALGPGDAPNYFYTFSSADAAIGPFKMRVGRVSGATMSVPKVLYTSNVKTNPATAAAVAAAGSNVFMPLAQRFDGPPPSSDKIIVTPDNAMGNTPTPRSLAPASGKTNIFFGGGPAKGAGAGFNVAFLEIDPASTTAPLAFRLGTVGPAKLPTFTADDVPVAFSFDSVTRLPTDGGRAYWSEDNFLAIGHGQGVPGLNFFWYDAGIKALRGNQTGPDTLLKNRPNIKRASVALAGAPVAIFTQFDLVWTETTTLTDGSMTEVLNYANLTCVR